MERNGLGYALGIFIFLANNFRLVSSNFLHERSSIFQIFLKIYHFVALQDGDSLSVADLPSSPCRFEFGGKLSFLVRNSEFSPFNYQEQNDSEGEIDERRSKDKRARKVVGQRWKNLELLNGKTTGSYYTTGTR